MLQLRGKKRKRYRLRPRFFVITGTALLLLVTGLGLLLRSCTASQPEPKPEPQSSSSGSLPKTGEDDSRYLADMLFTGDSRTRGLAFYGFVPERQVFAIDGLNHRDAHQKALFDAGDGTERLLCEAVGLRAPKRVLISFGINGMDYIEEEEYFSEYSALLDAIMSHSPQSVFILQSIYPVSAGFSAENPGLSNETIDRYNARLQQLAKEKQIFFLNTAEALKNEEGALEEAYDAGDGLHMSREAYKVILRYIREHPAPDASAKDKQQADAADEDGQQPKQNS